MKVSHFIILVVLIVLGLLYVGLENGASLHHQELKPAMEGQERGRIDAFKTIEYEPNSGSARAYVEVSTLLGRRYYRSGKVYDFTSAPVVEKWSVKSIQVIWDETRGDTPPLLTPYWKIR